MGLPSKIFHTSNVVCTCKTLACKYAWCVLKFCQIDKISVLSCALLTCSLYRNFIMCIHSSNLNAYCVFCLFSICWRVLKFCQLDKISVLASVFASTVSYKFWSCSFVVLLVSTTVCLYLFYIISSLSLDKISSKVTDSYYEVVF